MTREIRTIAVSGLEVRGGRGAESTIVGHAAVFDRDSEPIAGQFIERIQKGAFSRAIKEGQDVRALWNHDVNIVLGRTKSGTLTLVEDEVGLRVVLRPPDTQAGRDALASINRGDVDQMSFGFMVREQEWKHGENGGLDVRTLVDVDLFDVSPVTFPAYPDTDVAVRSHNEFRNERGHKMPRKEKRGQSGAKFLNDQIDSMVEADEDLSRGDVLKMMAFEASIAVPTVQEILAGEIDCPPRNRLAGFARALPVTQDQILSAFERDGCEYGAESNSRCGCREAMSRDMHNRGIRQSVAEAQGQ